MERSVQGRIAPSRSVRSRATTRSGSTSSVNPRPVHCGHAPWGELNEKVRGASSGSDAPCSGHANFSE